MSDVDVLIAGAGPTGLMLASELARRGCSVLIADCGDGPSTHSKALAVHSRTLEVLATLGLDQAFLERGRKLVRARVFAGGEELATIALDEIDSDYAFVLSIPQSETEQILLDRLHTVGGHVEWDTTVDSVEVGEGHVSARLTRGKGASRTVEARWLVGCDGARSTVREELGMGWEGDDIDLPFAFADLRLRTTVLRDDAFQVFLLDDSRVIGAVPLPDDELYRIITTLGPDQLGQETDRSFFRRLLEAEVDADCEIVDTIWFSNFTIRQRIARSYRTGRAFLAGDAAHAHSPAGAQGMNTGLQDAHNLAWKLAAVLSGSAPDSLLDSYETERRPIAQSVVSVTGAGTQAVGHLPVWKRTLRNLAISILPRIRPIRRRLLDMLSEVGVDYEESPIVVNMLGRAAGELRPGTFAPNLGLDDGSQRGSGQTLYSKLGNGCVLLSAQNVSLPQLPAEVTMVRVPPKQLKDRGVHTDAVFVIRPDGYIGFAGRPGDPELANYLREPWTAG